MTALFSPSYRLPSRASYGCLVIMITMALLSGLVPTALARYQPQPLETPTVVPVGDPGKEYMLLGEQPLTFKLQGPGVLSGFARVHFMAGETDPKPGRVIMLGVVGTQATTELVFKPSGKSQYSDGRPGSPSGGRRVEWLIPEGEHTVMYHGDCADGSAIFLILYYEGPGQEKASESVATQVVKEERDKPSRYSTRTSMGMDFIYDSNYLGLSEDYIDQWHTGDYPYKFRMRTVDEFILAPWLNVELRARYFGMGRTSFRFKLQHWQYTHNPIKNNQQFDFYLRQFVGSGKSLELSYFYAPEQYIRELSDRAPFTPAEDPVIWHAFNFTKNVLAVAYRHRLSRQISVKLILEKNLRYYNQPFIENDIDASEIRGTLYWSPHRRWQFSVDYSYEHAKARAIDTTGETAETSDDSDATYDRDLYRLGITWRPQFLKKLVDRIDASGLVMLYYYPTDKELFEDPFHAGRTDNVYKVSLGFERRILRSVTLDLAGRYTVRTVDSPWPGDITLDKDFTKYRIWLGLTYRL